MRTLLTLLILTFTFASCDEHREPSSIDPVNWKNRKAHISMMDSLEIGTSYLSVYPQIYSQTEHITHDLTATVSMRNISLEDTIYIDKAQYFNTHGKSIRTYFSETIYIAPMETVEIVIDELDREGGTGANFIFDWRIKPGSNKPHFEGVMISTSGQQGLSFSTVGIRIK